MISRIAKISGLIISFIIIVGVTAYITLTLIIKSEDTVVVPDLVGKDVVYVLEVLTGLGLNTKVGGSEYDARVAANRVISQDPVPGAEIKKGRDVRILLSKGAKTIWMPNLKGLSAQQARIILDENSLCQGELTLTYSKHVKKDEIIAQVPSPGAEIDRGGCVDLLVSMGMRPAAFKMPRLKGLSLDDAILVIERSNLLIGDIKYVFEKDSPSNLIIDQEPLYGHRVVDGSTVNLTINRESGERSRGPFDGIGGVGLFRYTAENGFLNRRIRVLVNSGGFSSELVNDFIKPGEEVMRLIPWDDPATVFLYEDGELVQTQVFGSK